jgi:hypothetical protein
MTRQQIIDEVFARNYSKITLDAALAALVYAKLAYFKSEPSKRKPIEHWFANTAE